MATTYEVTALISGKKRSKTELGFKTQKAAQKYADETRQYYPNSNPRVVKGTSRARK